MVQAPRRTTEIPPVIGVPVAQVVQFVVFVVAQRQFPWSRLFCGPWIFPSCSSLARCSTSRCAGPADSSGAGCEKSVEIPQLQFVVYLLGHCCCMPVVCNDRCLVDSECRTLWKFRSCRSSKSFNFPVVAQRLSPMVQSVIMDKMVDALVMQVQFLDEFVAPVWCRFHRCSSWTIVVPVCGDATGAVLGQGYGDFDRCRGPDSAYRLEVPQLPLIFNVVDFPVVAQRLFRWSRLSS